MEFEPVIGLEVHAQLKTRSKIFCGCSTEFGAEPNSHVCPVCLGMPGVLPVLNKKVVDYALRMAIATHCRISQKSRFARKNYFYPDLPKGYQISQYELPIALNGYIDIDLSGLPKRIGITRIHMEEDAGKLLHDPDQSFSRVDLNRTGVPLIEIIQKAGIAPDLNAVFLISAPDGYRSLISYGELLLTPYGRNIIISDRVGDQPLDPSPGKRWLCLGKTILASNSTRESNCCSPQKVRICIPGTKSFTSRFWGL